ncbi:hypothetical protein CKAH01_19163 [Colletotrichum kahawae]|uniref:Uncharacterized protein n=1 Tax=Colletotrichum kahawae TaxID=34407 RepID=A0AAD9XXI3_COLKA|nr:hypothetical protein CKAH01_19163 [Colletotrichum kahawae]
MSGRVQKSDSRETRRAQIQRNRKALGALVDHRGYDAMPCSPCFQHNRVCKMDLTNSKRCGECVKRGFSNCDGGDVRHKKFLKERGADLIRRGMQSVDEWETEERALEAQESRVIEDLSLWGAQNESDWPSLGTGFVDLGLPNMGSSEAS